MIYRRENILCIYLIGINKTVDMLERPIVNAYVILKHNSIIMHEIYIEQRSQDDDFKDVYAT